MVIVTRRIAVAALLASAAGVPIIEGMSPRHSPQPPRPAPDAGFSELPALGASYAAVRGTQRLVAGHQGALFRLRRESDNGERDFDAGPNGKPAIAAIAAFQGRSRLFFRTIYDQTGIGFHLRFPDGNSAMAAVNIADLTPSGALYVDTKDATSGEYASAGHAIDMQDHSLFVAQQSTSGQNGMLVSYDDGATTLECWSVNEATFRLFDTGPHEFGQAAVPLRANPAVVGITNGKASRRRYMSETADTTPGAPPATTASRIAYGKSKSSIFQFARWCGDALTSAALSADDGATLYRALSAIFGFTTTFDRRLIVIGDSIESEPNPMAGITPHRPPWTYCAFAGSTEVINLSVAGRTIAGQAGNMRLGGPYTGYASGGVAKYGTGKVVTYVQSGTNDIGILHADGDALADTMRAALANYRKLVPQTKILLATLAPFGGPSSDAAKQAARARYNMSIVANPGPADLLLRWDDPASTMGAPSAPDDRALYADGVHPTERGKRYRAGIDAEPSPIKLGPASLEAAVNALWG